MSSIADFICSPLKQRRKATFFEFSRIEQTSSARMVADALSPTRPYTVLSPPSAAGREGFSPRGVADSPNAQSRFVPNPEKSMHLPVNKHPVLPHFLPRQEKSSYWRLAAKT